MRFLFRLKKVQSMFGAEKHHIIFSKLNLSNKRNELVIKDRHEKKYYLANVKTFYHRRIIQSL